MAVEPDDSLSTAFAMQYEVDTCFFCDEPATYFVKFCYDNYDEYVEHRENLCDKHTAEVESEVIYTFWEKEKF